MFPAIIYPADGVSDLISISTSEDPALQIALVIERFSPTGGGVENVAWQVAHELDRQGVDVTVLTRSSHTQNSEAPDTHNQIKVRSLSVPTLWQPIRVLRFSEAARQATRRGGFDLVHSFSRTRQQDLYRAGGGSHREYMRRNYSAAGDFFRQLSPRHRTLLSIESKVFADPNQRIQCASRFVADTLIEKHRVQPERIFLLPNAVDSTRYGTPSAISAGRKLRAQLGAPPMGDRQLGEKTNSIWLFPASGWHRKGLPSLLEAFGKMHHPDLHLWIAGRDDPRPWRRRISELGIAEERIRFLGERNDLEAVYSAVDGMVLPTRYDAFANVTLEAAASGLAIITSKANGAAEWLKQSVFTIEDATDSEALVQAFRACSTAESRSRLGAGAQKIARKLDWQGHVAALRGEYERIIEARTNRLAP